MKKIIICLLILNSFLIAETSLNETNKLFMQKDSKNIIDSKKEYELDKERLKFLKEKTSQTQSQYEVNFKKIKDCEINAKNEEGKKLCFKLNNVNTEKENSINKFNPAEILNEVEVDLKKNNVEQKKIISLPSEKDLDRFKNQKLSNEEFNQIKNFSTQKQGN